MPPVFDPPARVGQTIHEVDTPALLIDLDAFERNLATLPRALATLAHPIKVRNHAKTHKSPEIARRQIAAGAVGVCCQKVAEAEVLVQGGVRDVLISNEVVGATKLARLAQLAGQARLGICVDAIEQIYALAEATQAAGTSIDVYVEIDVGAQRCGVVPGRAALVLAQAIVAQPSLRFNGLQAYHGPAQHERTIEARQARIDRAIAAARMTRDLIQSAGIDCPEVMGAGSGSFMFEAASGVYTEIQPGSYIFMDVDYAKNAWTAPQPTFEHALFVLATVMSRPTPQRLVLDTGLKALSVDSGLPRVWQREGVHFTKISDEHGVCDIDAGVSAPALGEKIQLIPGHCDPTVNLYDWYVCVRGGVVEAVWPILARGAFY